MRSVAAVLLLAAACGTATEPRSASSPSPSPPSPSPSRAVGPTAALLEPADLGAGWTVSPDQPVPETVEVCPDQAVAAPVVAHRSLRGDDAVDGSYVTQLVLRTDPAAFEADLRRAVAACRWYAVDRFKCGARWDGDAVRYRCEPPSNEGVLVHVAEGDLVSVATYDVGEGMVGDDVPRDLAAALARRLR